MHARSCGWMYFIKALPVCVVMSPFPCVWTVTLFQERCCMFPISSYRVQIELAIRRHFLAIPMIMKNIQVLLMDIFPINLTLLAIQLTSVSKSFSRYSSVLESLYLDWDIQSWHYVLMGLFYSFAVLSGRS